MTKDKCLKIFQKGEVLYQEGKIADYIFIVERGIVGLYSNSQEDEDPIAILSPGSGVGILDFFLGKVHIFSAKIETSTAKIIMIPRKNVKEYIKQNPGASFQIFYALITEGRSSIKQLNDLLKTDDASGKERADRLEEILVQETKRSEEM